MPCICYASDSEINEMERMIKYHCEGIVKAIKDLHKQGDPYRDPLQLAYELLEHLSDPGSCKENPDNIKQENTPTIPCRREYILNKHPIFQ